MLSVCRLSVMLPVCRLSVCLFACRSTLLRLFPRQANQTPPSLAFPPGSRYEPSLAASVADADLVVEAIVENLDIKQAVFAEVRGRWGETEGGLMELPGGCFRLHDYWAGSQVVRFVE